jgi:hypothetical protein
MATTNTDNRNRRWHKAALLAAKIFAGVAATIALLVATLIVAIYIKPNSHSLHIKNRSSNVLIVSGVRVNRLLLEHGSRTLRREGQNSLEYQFRARDRATLTLTVKPGTGAEAQLSCTLTDEHHAGCIYLVALKDGPSISCICDSLADHYH